jgi:hypothetical protein
MINRLITALHFWIFSHIGPIPLTTSLFSIYPVLTVNIHRLFAPWRPQQQPDGKLNNNSKPHENCWSFPYNLDNPERRSVQHNIQQHITPYKRKKPNILPQDLCVQFHNIMVDLSNNIYFNNSFFYGTNIKVLDQIATKNVLNSIFTVFRPKIEKPVADRGMFCCSSLMLMIKIY